MLERNFSHGHTVKQQEENGLKLKEGRYQEEILCYKGGDALEQVSREAVDSQSLEVFNTRLERLWVTWSRGRCVCPCSWEELGL